MKRDELVLFQSTFAFIIFLELSRSLELNKIERLIFQLRYLSPTSKFSLLKILMEFLLLNYDWAQNPKIEN